MKNLLFLAKVAKYMDQQGFDEEGDKKKFSVVWLVRKMVREAHHEAIRNVKVTLKVCDSQWKETCLWVSDQV